MKRLAFALLLLPSLALADGIAYRVGKAIQIVPTTTAPTKASGNGEIWIDSTASNVLKYKNPAGVTVTLGAGTGSYNQTIEDEGGAVTQRTNLNFVGAGVSCADSGGKTVCTIAGGGSTGNWTFTGDAADDSGAAVLTIGATTATGVTIGRTAGANILAADTTLASGKTLTGAAASDLYLNAVTGRDVRLRVNGTNVVSVGGSSVAINQSVSLAPNMGISISGAGTSAIDFSNGTGIFATTTGTNTLGGDVVLAANKNVSISSGTSIVSFAGGSGTFATTTGANYFYGSSNTFSQAIIPAADNKALGDSTHRWSTYSSSLSGVGNDCAATANCTSGGIQLWNTTAATASNQKYSPSLQWEGTGWKTNATAASQSVKMYAQLIPVEGAANPSVGLSIKSSINGAGYVEALNIGNLAILASVPISANLGATTVAPTWTAVTYTNSWVDFTGSTTTRYTKRPDGVVRVEVKAKNGSSATAAMFTLPVGYRPGQNMQPMGYTAAAGIACADLIASTGVFSFSVGSTAGVFATFEFFAEQ